MVAAPSEQPRRLDAEVADLLLVAVDRRPTVLFDDPLILLLKCFLLFLRLVLTDFRLLIQIDDGKPIKKSAFSFHRFSFRKGNAALIC